MIEQISWDEIFQIWSKKLWPERQSEIQQNSAMNYLNGYDLKNMTYQSIFFGYILNDSIVGVNSGHKCVDNSYRSRGLWVDQNYRKIGIGKKLLQHTIQQAKDENCAFIWSFPRYSSRMTYESVGFKITSHWTSSETSDANAYCKLEFS